MVRYFSIVVAIHIMKKITQLNLYQYRELTTFIPNTYLIRTTEYETFSACNLYII